MNGATHDFVALALAHREAAFPERARSMAIDAITDLLGCMIAGAGEPVAGMLGRIVADGGDRPGLPAAPLAAADRMAAPHDSALYNGTLAHAIDYDDVTHPAYAHPGASLVPAILATATAKAPSASAIRSSVPMALATGLKAASAAAEFSTRPPASG